MRAGKINSLISGNFTLDLAKVLEKALLRKKVII